MRTSVALAVSTPAGTPSGTTYAEGTLPLGKWHPNGDPDYAPRVISPTDRIAELFAREGMRSYLGEQVSIAVHMLQTGALAEKTGAADAIVAAALLHDVGHFEAVSPRPTRARQLEEQDFRHQDSGADWLAQWFSTEVTEPVRLHVLAKRYLCAVERTYLARLSPASVHTLALQGGPLTPAEVGEFERMPHAQAAVNVRRWDDQAKDPGVATPAFEHFRGLLSQLATTFSVPADHFPKGPLRAVGIELPQS